MHADHAPAAPVPLVAWALPVLLLLLGVAYLALVARGGGEARRWPAGRTASFRPGVALDIASLTDPLAAWASASIAGHMAQHLIVGMLAPLLMVLGAPVTLLLHHGPPSWRRPIGAILHSPYVRFVAHPVTALVLSVGSLPLLYGTGLYAASQRSPELHVLVLVHVLASGYLFAWVIAGPDPAPRRPTVPWRLVVLGVAVLAHATVSQLVYAGLFRVAASDADRRLGATLMYYAGISWNSPSPRRSCPPGGPTGGAPPPVPSPDPTAPRRSPCSPATSPTACTCSPPPTSTATWSRTPTA